MIGFSDILGQLRAQVIPFLVVKPSDLLGEIGHEEKAGQTNDGCEQTLDNEYPSPAIVAADTCHLADSSGQDTTEGTGEGGGAEEKAEALLGLATGVPHAHQVKACECQHLTVQRSENCNDCTYIRGINPSRKLLHKYISTRAQWISDERNRGHTQKPPSGHQATPILHQTLENHNKTESEHAERY